MSDLIQKMDHEWITPVVLYKRATVSDLIQKSDHEWITPVILYKRATVSNLIQKSDHERITPVALYKRATVSDLIQKSDHEWITPVALYKRATESHFHSFPHKKRAICLKNWWANSQPRFFWGNTFVIFFNFFNFSGQLAWNIKNCLKFSNAPAPLGQLFICAILK